ncbi:hypothetical protein GQ44DRAFT_724941 [Phaeosphaeriaceae sp. PMI808]|nr:hypothetical protein GQ44DRAFT_724941 [Phaeosphaeriaceae sp. PMI808]
MKNLMLTLFILITVSITQALPFDKATHANAKVARYDVFNDPEISTWLYPITFTLICYDAIAAVVFIWAWFFGYLAWMKLSAWNIAVRNGRGEVEIVQMRRRGGGEEQMVTEMRRVGML